MKKQSTSGGSKILFILIGLVFVAVLAFGVVWSTRSMKTNTPVAQAPATERMKIPQTPPPMPRPQFLPAESTRPQPAGATVSALPQEAPPQESVRPQPVSPQTQITQVETPADGSTSGEAISAPPEPPSQTKAEPPTPLDETPDVAAVKETPEPTAPAADAPEDGTSAQENVNDVQPEENASVHTSENTPSEPSAIQSPTDTNAGTARFNLQVGAYRVEAYAHETMDKLSKRGYNPFILEIIDARQRTWYTVRIGRYYDRNTAAESLNRLKQEENITAVIARSGKL